MIKSSTVQCTCHHLRSSDELKEKGHIMGCAVRTRIEAVQHYEYEQSLKKVQQLLEAEPGERT